MNEKKLKEVGTLTDTDPSDLEMNKIKRKITLMYYYLIQYAFLITSGYTGLVFGIYEKSKTTYPYIGFEYNYWFGPIFVAIVQGGNFGMSYGLRKTDKLILKKGTNTKLSPFYVYPVVFLNLILSLVLFFFIYFIVTPDPMSFPMYGAFIRKKATSKNVFSWSNHV